MEVSRIFSAIISPVQKTLIESTTIGGVQVEKGLLIDMNWLCIFYNEEIFEKPFEFVPERWEREDYQQKKSLVDLNFGAGPRGCIGKTLALTEMKVMMIKLMQRYQNVEELGFKDRTFEFAFSKHIKNAKANLTKR